jgi:hypothetical protein
VRVPSQAIEFYPESEKIRQTESKICIFGSSPKISQAKALVRFSRYGAAQEAALEENWVQKD